MVHLRRKYVIGTLAAVGLLFNPAATGSASASTDRSCTLGGCPSREDGAERVEHGRGERERGPGGDRRDNCDESGGPGRRDQRFDDDRSASSSRVATPSSSTPGDDVDGEDGCTLPPPVVPEAPWSVLLPLSAAGTAVIVFRRRGRPLAA
jgi:hypothetical protein